ncbi:hypothetical protein SteCoe_11155 [Stentor coeruleus]|uniref:Palmitoyltransferase n=1 Tax=Stentor coeruleus TaxID=5963 RepID=A0A1R2CDW1_9CILI|nr:hypothetical protein SteCoe_11155 [Stentor coeruleus]
MSDGNDLEADLVIALQTLDTQSFKDTLQKSNVEIGSLQDQSKSNIFHEFAKSIIQEKLLVEFLEITISFFYKRYGENAPESLKFLMNSQTIEEKFTPLHLAVKSGKLKLTKEYIRMGGDTETKTSKDQSIGHMVSIQGSMPILAYLKYEVGVNIQEKDSNGMTPLHLAAKFGNEYVVLSLVAWKCDANAIDNDENTPLHLAAFSGNYGVCRALLFAGANRKSLNSLGENPYTVANRQGNTDVLKILANPSILARINPFKHPIKPVKNSYKLYAFFVILFILRYILVILFVIPHLDIEFSIISLMIFLFSTITFMMVSHSNPGFVHFRRKETMVFLYQTYQAEFVCPFCETRKPPKARHCPYCNRCVKKYDHHCPWIRNCVGKGNHKLFVVFIIFICIDFLYNAVVGVLDYLDLFGPPSSKFFSVDKYRPEAALIISGISFISFLFAFPVAFIQVTNIIKKTTTHERFAYNKSSKASSKTMNSSMPSMTMIHSSEEHGGEAFATNITISVSSNKKSKYCCYGSSDKAVEMLSAE